MANRQSVLKNSGPPAHEFTEFENAAAWPGHQLIAVDLEFTRLPLSGEGINGWLSNIQVLSLGLCTWISGKRRTLYVRAKLNAQLREICNEFVTAQVLPRLASAKPDVTVDTFEAAHPIINEFITERARQSGLVPALVSDWPGDLSLVQKVLGNECPLLLDGYKLINALGAREKRIKRLGLVRHNAMHDAIWTGRMLGLDNLKGGPGPSTPGGAD